MPDPADLPIELFDKVLDHFAADISSDIPIIFANGDADTKHFYACCLVSRQWKANSTPRLYSRWIYNGKKNTFTRLWKFLRTILSKPEIAILVQSAGIKGLDSNPGYYKALPAKRARISPQCYTHGQHG